MACAKFCFGDLNELMTDKMCTKSVSQLLRMPPEGKSILPPATNPHQCPTPLEPSKSDLQSPRSKEVDTDEPRSRSKLTPLSPVSATTSCQLASCFICYEGLGLQPRPCSTRKCAELAKEVTYKRLRQGKGNKKNLAGESQVT